MLIEAADDFEFFRSKLRQLAGIKLSEAKRELLRSRLRERVSELGFGGLSEYRLYLERLSSEDSEWQVMINLLTTNKTEWFREPKHFDYLVQEFLPRWKKSGNAKLSVWCAACSTGEEPYTLAMVLREALGGESAFEITASDIDTDVLKTAAAGVYPVSKLEAIPEPYRERSFARGTGEIAAWAKVKRDLKSTISFQRLNLIEGAYPWSGKFDLIFCRNVFIYFPKEIIETVVQNMHQAAKPDALLLIGHSESLQNVRISWRYLRPSIYEKR